MSKLEDAEARLWETTQEDWYMQIGINLTEPTCPFISIYPDEGSRFKPLEGYIAKTRDIEAEMVGAIEYLLERIATDRRSP